MEEEFIVIDNEEGADDDFQYIYMVLLINFKFSFFQYDDIEFL